MGSPHKFHPAGRKTVEGPYQASVSKVLHHSPVLFSITLLKSSVTRGQARLPLISFTVTFPVAQKTVNDSTEQSFRGAWLGDTSILDKEHKEVGHVLPRKSPELRGSGLLHRSLKESADTLRSDALNRGHPARWRQVGHKNPGH